MISNFSFNTHNSRYVDFNFRKMPQIFEYNRINLDIFTLLHNGHIYCVGQKKNVVQNFVEKHL